MAHEPQSFEALSKDGRGCPYSGDPGRLDVRTLRHCADQGIPEEAADGLIACAS
jgi:hypothetical protein